MPTPHINANPGDFADIVLMPGDPLRAKWIAETYLDNMQLVTSVRNMYGYTGVYRGKRLSVMAHGMGIPSCSIYTAELIKHYGVKTVIRVGSCGAVTPALELGDVVIAMGACTDSNTNRMRFMGHDFAAMADFHLVRTAADVAKERHKSVTIGSVFSTDLFYSAQPMMLDVLARMGVVAVEMELAGMYGVAAESGAHALGLLTVSDIIPTQRAMRAEEREKSFQDMMEIALETTLKLSQ